MLNSKTPGSHTTFYLDDELLTSHYALQFCDPFSLIDLKASTLPWWNASSERFWDEENSCQGRKNIAHNNLVRSTRKMANLTPTQSGLTPTQSGMTPNEQNQLRKVSRLFLKGSEIIRSIWAKECLIIINPTGLKISVTLILLGWNAIVSQTQAVDDVHNTVVSNDPIKERNSMLCCAALI